MVDNKNNERMHSLFINRPLKTSGVIIYSTIYLSRKFILNLPLTKLVKI